MRKLIVMVGLSLIAAVPAATVSRAEAAIPMVGCAKNGEALPAGTNRFNTVLVRLWHFDKDDQPITKGRFRLVRIGQNNQHITVAGVRRPGCWVLFTRLPNFSHEPLTLCVVLRGSMQAMPDPANPNRPAACPTPTLDGVSGLYTYKFYVQSL